MRRNDSADGRVRLISLQKRKGCTGVPTLAHVVLRRFSLDRGAPCGWSWKTHYFFRTWAARSATSSLRAHPIWAESSSLNASIWLASEPAMSASKRGAIPSAVTATTTRLSRSKTGTDSALRPLRRAPSEFAIPRTRRYVLAWDDSGFLLISQRKAQLSPVVTTTGEAAVSA